MFISTYPPVVGAHIAAAGDGTRRKQAQCTSRPANRYGPILRKENVERKVRL